MTCGESASASSWRCTCGVDNWQSNAQCRTRKEPRPKATPKDNTTSPADTPLGPLRLLQDGMVADEHGTPPPQEEQKAKLKALERDLPQRIRTPSPNHQSGKSL